MKTLALLALVLLPACSVVERVGVHVLGRRAEIPVDRVVREIFYTAANEKRQSLDLYLPAEKNPPVIVFIHGGGWNTGDKNLRAGGLDVYGNIGRFYASRGIATAVINYRLMPAVTWRDQLEDAAQAVAWVHGHAPRYGADASRLFVMGHSAGAWIASNVALNQGLQEFAGLKPGDIDGLICASGAALDLLDEKTFETEDIRYYVKRFGPRDQVTWAEASPATHIDDTDPRALVLVTTGEAKGLQRQALIFSDRLAGSGVKTGFVAVKGESHSRMVLVLSHPDKAAAPEILRFVFGEQVPVSAKSSPR